MQNDQHQTLVTVSPSVAPINPALLRAPGQKTAPNAVNPPPEVQKPTVTPHLPALLPVQETVALPVATPKTPVRGGFPNSLSSEENIVLSKDGNAYSIRGDSGNQHAVRVGSKFFNNIIRERALEQGITLRKGDISDINAMLQACAERDRVYRDIWLRIAKITDGVEIDLGDDNHTHVRITPGKVEIITSGSETLFYRSPISLPMVMPSETGELNRLKKYLNLHPADAMIFIAWISYTAAHAKIPTSKFPLLVLNGPEGLGKSFTCYIISCLIDPCRIVLQKLPTNDKDLAITAQNGHVICFDNIRSISPAMSDNFCIAATGGVISTRQLYTDADMSVLNLHCAIVLNGIHAFIGQQDLAQRCVVIHPQPIEEKNRKSESVLEQELKTDLPYIIRGLFDLIAEIFKYLPTVKPICPERMIDFSHWLGALEKVQGAPEGVYQMQYSDVLKKGRLDGLQENELGVAMLAFAEEPDGENWQGTPDELLAELNRRASKGTLRSRDWPINPISLSKRLAVLQAGLKSQGIDVTFGRGKKRSITINTTQAQ